MTRSTAASVIWAAKRMLDLGLVSGTAGNVSSRDPGGADFWITPSGIDFATLTPAQVVHVDREGRPLASRRIPSSDTMNHAAIYRRRRDVRAVVHTHSPYASVFAVLRRPIPAVLVEAAGFLGGEVPVMSYLPPATPELGERAAQGLGESRAVLLPNHGVITVGESVESAITAAQLVEQSARVAYLASLLGKPKTIPPREVARMHRFLHHEYGRRPARPGR